MAATTLDSIDIANILAQELLYQQLASSLDGLHSGVPTRTTPTLTPTTLRSIEQTFLEFTSESASHSREAGFVPPLIEPSQPTPAQTHNNAIQQHNNHHHHQQQQQQQQGNNVLLEVPPQTQQPQLQQQQQQQQQAQTQPQQTRRNMGGRRPTRTVGMTPEEEERRQIRRERNKLAAARCRKRRMDHTNSLLEETQGLEQKKQNLQDEIQQLQQTKDELEFMLDAHRAVCRLQSSSPPDIKPIVPETDTVAPSELQPEEFAELSCNGLKQHQQQQPQQHQPQPQQQQQQQQHQHDVNLTNGLRPNRPNSLSVGFAEAAGQRPNSLPIFTEPKPRPSSLHFKTVETPAFMKTATEVAGVPITTPSTVVPFNFESLMDGGTGLTPVSTPLIPSCSSQQRNSNGNANSANLAAVDLSSPDANPPKLVSL